MNKRKVLLIGTVILVLAVIAAGAALAANNQERPFKGMSYEWVTEEGELDGSDCPADTVHITGEGEATHLGKFTVERTHCFTPPNHPEFPGSVMHDGEYTITAANGDTLWGTYSGELQPTEFGEEGPIKGIITGPATVDGGTGRFNGAEGEHTIAGDYDLVADEGWFELEGWLSY